MASRLQQCIELIYSAFFLFLSLLCIFAGVASILFKDKERVLLSNSNLSNSIDPLFETQTFGYWLWIVTSVSLRYNTAQFLESHHHDIIAVAFVFLTVAVFNVCLFPIIVAILRNILVILRPDSSHNIKKLPKTKVNNKENTMLFTVISSRWYSFLITTCVLLNVGAMALRNKQNTESFFFGLQMIEYVMLIVFTIDIVLRFAAIERRSLRYFFLKSSSCYWNMFDTIVLLLTYVDIGFKDLGLINLSFFRIFRLFRLARVLRYIHSFQEVFVILNSCKYDILWTSFLTLLNLSIFASLSLLVLSCNKSHFFNFCSGSEALVSLFVASIGNKALNVAETTGAYTFMLIFYIVVVIISLNLFVAILLRSFQSNMKFNSKVSSSTCSDDVVPKMTNQLETFLENKYIQFISIIVSILSSLIVILEIGDDLKLVLEAMVLFVFGFEACIKILARGKSYFRDYNDCFDFLLLCFGIVDFVLFALQAQVDITWLLLFRFLRPIRVLFRVPFLNSTAKVLIKSCYGAITVFFILLISLLSFSIIAMQLYQDFETNSPFSSFSNIYVSMRTLYEIVFFYEWANKYKYCLEISQVPTSITSIFFGTVIIIGHFILLKVMVGLVSNYFKTAGRITRSHSELGNQYRSVHKKMPNKSSCVFYMVETLLNLTLLYKYIVYNRFNKQIFFSWLIWNILFSVKFQFVHILVLISFLCYCLSMINLLMVSNFIFLTIPIKYIYLFDNNTQTLLKVITNVWHKFVKIFLLQMLFYFMASTFAYMFIPEEPLFSGLKTTSLTLFLIVVDSSAPIFLSKTSNTRFLKPFLYFLHFFTFNVFWNIFVAITIEEYQIQHKKLKLFQTRLKKQQLYPIQEVQG